MKDDRTYLNHIQECIARIQSYVSGGEESFMSSTLVQDAVLRNLQTLGESSQRLSPTMQAAHPAVNWRGMAGFRNILVHNYLGVNLVRVWALIEQFLPELEGQIQTMLHELREPP